MNDAPLSAAILAGGLGTRLLPAVADRPKVLAEVAGQPFLAYLLERLTLLPIEEVVLLVGHRADQVRARFGERWGPLRLVYSEEPSPLGTAGALRHALPMLSQAPVLLCNGDSWCDADLADLVEFHLDHALPATLTLTRVADCARYGQVELATSGLVERFDEKRPEAGPGWINAGIYLLDRYLLEHLPSRSPLSLERDVLPGLVARGQVRGWTGGGAFLDIGTPESYRLAEAFLLSRTG